jgi:hypothetical protein
MSLCGVRSGSFAPLRMTNFVGTEAGETAFAEGGQDFVRES